MIRKVCPVFLLNGGQNLESRRQYGHHDIYQGYNIPEAEILYIYIYHGITGIPNPTYLEKSIKDMEKKEAMIIEARLLDKVRSNDNYND